MKQNNPYQPAFDWRFIFPQYWLTWLVLSLLWFLNLLPFKLKQGLSNFLGRKVYQYNAKRRNIVETNLALAFPGKSQQQRKQMALRFTCNAVFILLDYPLLLWSGKKTLHKRIRFKGLEHIKQCQQKNKTVILLTCHMLALEYGALALTEKVKTVGLIKPARNKLFEWFIARGRTRFEDNARLYLREKGIRPVIREIKNQRVFYYLPDEDLGEKAKACFVPFFGVETATLTALAPMVKMTNATVIPAVTVLDEKTGNYIFEVEQPLDDFPVTDELENMKRMNQVIEQLILKAPEQYMWSLRLFQTRPDGAPPPYQY
jgi:lauroyl-KDO2-lipid IV(A) myristoyltransferase